MSRGALADATTPPKARKATPRATSAVSDYFHVSRRPWASLLFLLPLIAVYELGTAAFVRDAATGAEYRIIAFNLLNDFLRMFGATGRYLPAFAVVSILVAWHLARKDPWHVRPRVIGGMWLESACWALPLLALAVLMGRYLPLLAADGPTPGTTFSAAGEAVPRSWAAAAGGGGGVSLVVLSIGAGIYEELVFRLIGFAVCGFVLVDLLGVRPSRALFASLVITAVAFSLYHYLGHETPHWRSFLFRTLAGLFFGAVYLWRGFGVAAGTHAAYDVLVFSLR